MANIRLSGFTEKASPAAADHVYVHDATSGQERKTLLSAIRSYVLGGKTVGGTSAGDIANIDSAQTFTNKRLNSPGINSATAVTADSAELNKLDGCTLTTAELNRLSGVTSNVQDQINGLGLLTPAVDGRLYYYGTGTITGTSSQTITESALRTASGAGTGYRVDQDTLMVSVFKLVSTTWYQIPPADGTEGQVEFSTATTSGTVHLNQIGIKLDSGTSYKIAVHYRVKILSGV